MKEKPKDKNQEGIMVDERGYVEIHRVGVCFEF